MKKTKQNSSSWLLVITLLAACCIGAAIFFYYNFFRQDNAKLIETVPTDATFVFAINDNEAFGKSVSQLAPYMNDLFNLSSFAGFQSFLDRLPSRKGDNQIMISSHKTGDQSFLLYSTAMSQPHFSKLLKNLQIDNRNCVVYDENKIYQFGTHYRKFFFVWHHNVFSVSENIDLLKKCIKQHQSVKNFLTKDEFKDIFSLVEKNNNQNWLLIHYANYLNELKNNFSESYQILFQVTPTESDSWAAYQLRFSENEMKLAGYIQTSTKYLTENNKLFDSHLPTEILPANAEFFIASRPNAPTYFFSLTPDSITHYYTVLPADTTNFTMDHWLPAEHTLDSCIKFKGTAIYQANTDAVNPAPFHRDLLLNCFISKGGYAIFADSVDAMKPYINQIGKTNTIEDNPQYRAVCNNLPSQYAYCIAYFFNLPQSREKVFSVKGLESISAKKISAFALTFSTPVNQLVASNIYLKF
ncbi:MAG: hypothetical protein MJZ76_02215 [Bacteroidales bacterium]|nr:hypothetical protein [Bacteroidales bacterium]